MKKIVLTVVLLAFLVSAVGCLRSADVGTVDDVSKKNEEITGDTEEFPQDPETTEETDGTPTGGEEQPVDGEVTPDPDDGNETQREDVPVVTTGEPDKDGIVHVLSIVLDRYETTLTVGQIDMPWETVYPTNASDKSTGWQSSDRRVATVDQYGRVTAVGEGECVITDASVSDPAVTAEFRVTVKEKKKLTEPTYIDGILIANKSYPLPETYNPGVDSEAYDALERMINGAASDGITLTMVSGFRSYETQQTLYARYLLREGRDAADTYSARPGYSEHQTGLAFDLNSLEYSFGETAEGKWLAAHCAEYGFIIRYPEGKDGVTGYHYEPWHVRYLGTDIAEKVYESGLCLEEYLGITSEYAY